MATVESYLPATSGVEGVLKFANEALTAAKHFQYTKPRLIRKCLKQMDGARELRLGCGSHAKLYNKFF